MSEFSGNAQKLRRPKALVPAGDFIATRDAKRFAIGVDAKESLRFQQGDVEGDHIVMCIRNSASSAYRAHLRAANVSYLLCGNREVDLSLALQKLRSLFGIKKLLLEGGGKFNGSMLREGLVDHVSQVVVPLIDGGTTISGMFDVLPESNRATAQLKLLSLKKLPGGAHWLRYDVTKTGAR